MREIRVGSKGQFVTVVSDGDYHFLANWRWTFARSHPRANRELIYARRSVRIAGPMFWSDQGAVPGPKVKFDLFLHHVVLARMGYPEPPEPHWTADHIDHNTLDNQRSNLRWASPTFQALNRAGSYSRDARHAKHVAEALASMAALHTVPAPMPAPAPDWGSMPLGVNVAIDGGQSVPA